MSESLGPLPDDVAALIKRAGTPAPPPDFADSVFQRLDLSPLGGAAVTGLAGAKLVAVILGAAALGTAGGVALDRLLLADAPEPKVIVKEVRVEVPVPAPPAEPPAREPKPPPPPPAKARPAPAAPPVAKEPLPRAEPAAAADAQLREERAILEIARTALSRGDAAGALARLDEHAQKFPSGRLAEERDALAVTALATLGRTEDARAKARAFLENYPDSLLAPQVKRAVR